MNYLLVYLELVHREAGLALPEAVAAGKQLGREHGHAKGLGSRSERARNMRVASLTSDSRMNASSSSSLWTDVYLITSLATTQSATATVITQLMITGTDDMSSGVAIGRSIADRMVLGRLRCKVFVLALKIELCFDMAGTQSIKV